MAIIPVWRELLAGTAAGPGCLSLLAALEETYGPEVYGPGGAPGALARTWLPAIGQIARVGGDWWEASIATLLGRVYRHLPPPPPDVYLGTLLFLAPAATLSLQGRPVVAVGLERFDPLCPPGMPPPRGLYHPSEVEEMLPHEAAHVARIRALGLCPSPRDLTLADMVLLEGTALLFTDWFLGRQTLPTFMPAAEIARHQAEEAAHRAVVRGALGERGMPAFLRFFRANAPVSGYYVGLSLCREYCARTGVTPDRLVLVPTREILAAVGLGS
ncbi:DUF2268 domain-containing protein [Caldinitratiruptor microaerophilus]|uniref:DUF2268 domain-containing protein n=1 Tax=Caldinitratiruptor microaerophilus TaxID=671077 RepID=A0AA35CM35_9FIRM|nr:DUF2268 domain-containing protein [Caldinitratiruptor microaerophilus]BDG60908.1 hypothetical protein caldi_19980 [Caldinitratiruptor microaerophilus]